MRRPATFVVSVLLLATALAVAAWLDRPRQVGSTAGGSGRTGPEIGPGEDGQSYAWRLDDLAESRYRSGDLAGAEAPLREALRQRELVFGPWDSRVADSYDRLGRLLRDSGRYDEAESCYFRARIIRQENLEAGHPDLALSAFNLGRVREARGDAAAALEFYDEAEAIWAASFGEEHWRSAWVMSHRGMCLMRLGSWDEAGSTLRTAHGRLVRALGPDHPRVAISLARQAEWLDAVGRAEDAHRLRQELKRGPGTERGKKNPDSVAVESPLSRTDL